MNQDLNPSHYAHITRADRAVTDEAWMIALLQRVPMATLATAIATTDAEAPQPFLSTLLYVYDAARHVIYLHTARRGRVWDNLQVNPSVCLTAAEMGRMLPAATALNFSVEYSSVVVFANAKLVLDSTEAENALQQLLDKYFSHLQSGTDYRPITPGELEATAVYRLEITAWSGKRKAVADDFPGAFTYPYHA